MTENEKTELFDKWYDENYDEWAEGEEGIALREELEQAFKGGIAELENKIADIKANCDLAIEGRDIKIKELEKENAELKSEKGCEICTKFDEVKLTKAKEIILKLYNAGRDVLMCRAEEKAYDNLENAINDRSIEQFLKEIEK